MIDTHHWIYSAQMKTKVATDEEYNNKVQRQWSQKALHGRDPHDLSQQHVDIEASNNLVAIQFFLCD